MLRNIDPLLTPDLLRALAAMGHGDTIAVCDANFPAYSVAGAKPLIHLPDAGALAVVRAILTLMPLDTFVEHSVLGMQQVGDAETPAPIQREADEMIFSKLDPVAKLGSLERHAYYAKAREAFAVVATGERKPYGNFLLYKGVL